MYKNSLSLYCTLRTSRPGLHIVDSGLISYPETNIVAALKRQTD